MYKLIFSSLFFMLAGCFSLAPIIKGPSELKNSTGVLAFNFESTWPHPNDSFLGKQLVIFIVNDEGKERKKMGKAVISFTSPDTFKAVQLLPGRYIWYMYVIDHRVTTVNRSYIYIKKGSVTNLGKVNFDIVWPDGYGPKVLEVSQGGFSAIDKNLCDLGINGSVDDAYLFPMNEFVPMGNLGRDFWVKYSVEKASERGQRELCQ
ncbi:hypothetical protein [Pleionea sp. CnH1-48]|uniref:hypothetical protein n=1 Tax=Pleionea sp. CnH1-48 TaxID=2954494 RepID=UPI00209720D7|nr:hypothetical protein [Pleionea sp. CnH1-48]MCO7227594.1 hypothetical protein [Pleionea sp. CnH1-48]